MSKFGVGQGVQFCVNGQILHGVVVGVSDRSLSLCQVLSKRRLLKQHICYNEVGAEYALNRDNVKLRDCPPPFSELYAKSPGGAFVYANVEKPHILSKQKCEEYGVQIVDDGFLLTDDMMREIYDHPWNTLHKEKSGLSGRIRGDGSRPLPSVNDNVSSITNDYDL